MKYKFTLFTITTLILFACQNSPKKEQEQSNQDSLVKEKPEIIKEITINYKAIDPLIIKELNSTIKIKKLKTPEEIMAEFSPKSDVMEGKYNYDLQINQQENNKVELTLIETGLMDDSQSALMLIMNLEKYQDTYKVVSIKETWKCWPGRGHENWSTEFCN